MEGLLYRVYLPTTNIRDGDPETNVRSLAVFSFPHEHQCTDPSSFLVNNPIIHSFKLLPSACLDIAEILRLLLHF